MKWYFEPRRDNDGTTHDEDDSATGVISLPAAVLRRHGAVVLDPGKAAEVPGYPPPRSTVYRARTLLVPDYLLQGPDPFAPVNMALERVRMKLVPPEPDRDTADDDRGIFGILRELPRPAVLVPAEGDAVPVVIDAWVALQALRAAAADQRTELDPADVQQITLEHLLISSATISGSPAGNSGGDIIGGSALTAPGSTDSYTYAGGDTRTPVAVVVDAPKRKPSGTCASEYGRRPVVAVLDTGARVHPWLDVETDPTHRYRTVPDGFVAVDHAIQEAIHTEGMHAATSGDWSRQVIRHPWDTPVTADPLLGELDSDTGHCTFISGIVRQVVPDAQVLAVRIMHGDGLINEGDLLCALRQLAKRIAFAEQGDMAAMVDVVSLSFGYYSESAQDAAYTSGLRKAIDALLSLGVTVVAAAGNFSTSRRFYPAAFTEPAPAAGQVPLISVGALNPNGSKALFSNGGRWITAWATGAAMVSTFPTDINGSLCPEIRMRAHPANEMPPGSSLPAERAALDPDDYSSGFAIWNGTSFSTPLVAAQIVRSLLEGAADPGLRLDLPGKQAATDRALAALQNLGWEG